MKKKPDLYNISGLTSYFLCRKEEDTSLPVFCHPGVHYLKHIQPGATMMQPQLVYG